jgi:hypothetical protein
MNIEQLKEYFAEQISRGITNLFFMTQEVHPANKDEWCVRVIPAAELAELVPHLQDYTYYRNTNHCPHFYKCQVRLSFT